MAWVGTFTFTGDLSSPLQFVRSLVGDTNADEPKLYDEQITPFLPGGASGQANAYYAAAAVADLIGATSAGSVQSLSAGGTSVTWSNRATSYADLARRLRTMGARSGSLAPFVGGASLSDMAARRSDTDRTPESFARNLGEFPGNGAASLAGCER